MNRASIYKNKNWTDMKAYVWGDLSYERSLYLIFNFSMKQKWSKIVYIYYIIYIYIYYTHCILHVYKISLLICRAFYNKGIPNLDNIGYKLLKNFNI